jgi:hypothetical protein
LKGVADNNSSPGTTGKVVGANGDEGVDKDSMGPPVPKEMAGPDAAANLVKVEGIKMKGVAGDDADAPLEGGR